MKSAKEVQGKYKLTYYLTKMTIEGILSLCHKINSYVSLAANVLASTIGHARTRSSLPPRLSSRSFADGARLIPSTKR